MCVPSLNAVSTIIDVSSGIFKQVMNVKEKNDAIKYRTQVAVNNAKQANKQALFQKQTGIDEARKEKIEGIRRQKQLIANNSASGFSLTSDTNKNNYQDITDFANSRANETQNAYDLKANDYFNKAQGYIDEANSNVKSKNSSLLNLATIGIDSVKQVSDKWYKNSYGGNNELF